MRPIPGTIYIVSAAGGNHTALEILDEPRDRSFYESRGRELMHLGDAYQIEQSGFVILRTCHLEMAGGEFCGNATRAATLLLSRALEQLAFNLTVSGAEHPVRAYVTHDDERHAHVSCTFHRLPTTVTEVTLSSGETARVVDLGGIVHVQIEQAFPRDKEVYESAHRRITAELGLAQRDAVGVCWLMRNADLVQLHPVVWVRAIDEMFYESSCGSGSIAVNAATGQQDIVQPSGKRIRVEKADDQTVLTSEMEVIHVITA